MKKALVVSSAQAETADAVLEIAQALVAAGVDDDARRCALVFASAAHGRDPPALALALDDALRGIPFIGWIGETVFADLVLREGGPGLAVLILDDVDAHVRTAPARGLGSHAAAALVADAPLGRARFLAGPAPVEDVEDLLLALDEHPVPTAGGLGPAALGRGGSALARDLDVPSYALLALSPLELVVTASQSVRALGPAHRVSQADGRLISDLDGRPALDTLVGDASTAGITRIAPLADRLVAALGEPDDDGSFVVVREITSVDRKERRLGLSARVSVGTMLTFAVKDPASARAHLEADLFELKSALGRRRPRAVILFASELRQERFLDVPLFDVERVLDVLGPLDVPVVGTTTVVELGTASGRLRAGQSSLVIAALLEPDEG